MANEHLPQDSGPIGLVATPPPAVTTDGLPPEEVESYLRAAMHQDRSPGNVLVICHPLRMYKVPADLLDALRQAGWGVRVVETARERVASVRGIRDALAALAGEGRPLDILVISGDGSLDHHALVAAFWCFYPDLVREVPGVVDVSGVDAGEVSRSPYWESLLQRRQDVEGLEPTEANLHQLWVLRTRLTPLLRRGRSAATIVQRSGLAAGSPMLRAVVLASLFPGQVRVQTPGFDLSGLAEAGRERMFHGLYPYIRAIAVYPAGTAADNALYAGVPGWRYAQAARLLGRSARLSGLRERWSQHARDTFVAFFTQRSLVVPARFSLVAFEGRWQLISTHAAGGPGSGHFFSADLESKTGGLLGYLVRIPQVVLREGVLGSTIVRIQVTDGEGLPRLTTQAQMAEGLYTNRAFIGAIGSVPSTDPTSFAGQSSLIIVPPIRTRERSGGGRWLDVSGLAAFLEGMVKGISGRSLHWMGWSVGNLAGRGRFALLAPEHQIALQEGETVDIQYRDGEGQPLAVPIQVSGDPFQATRMSIKVAWGPLPLLASDRSLLLGTAQRALARLQVAQTWRLQNVIIGGLFYFHHRVGAPWSEALVRQTGLLQPPRHLPRRLEAIQDLLLRWWEQQGGGRFVDTTEIGLRLGRRVRHAQSHDQSAHLVLLREESGELLVRQIRRDPATEQIYEARAAYRPSLWHWVIAHSEVRQWSPDQVPRILTEEHFFRNVEDFRKEAPSFFPFVAASDAEGGALSPVLPPELPQKSR